MDMQERYNDIAKKTGLSENIIRSVFKATRDSVIESLKHGERATIPGICNFTPDLRVGYDFGGDKKYFVKAKIKVSSTFEKELKESSIIDQDIKNGKTSVEDLTYVSDGSGIIRATQINSLL